MTSTKFRIPLYERRKRGKVPQNPKAQRDALFALNLHDDLPPARAVVELEQDDLLPGA